MTSRITGPDEVEEQRMPLMEHLRELRYRVMVGAGALFVGMFLGMLVVEPVYALLTAPMRLLFENADSYPVWDQLYVDLTTPVRMLLPASLTEVQIDGTLALTTSPMEGVYTWLRVALVSGVILSSPVLAWQFWQFVAPGLYKAERRVVLPLTLASAFLFTLGALFAYSVLLPVAFPFFLQVLKAKPLLSIDGYMRAVVRMLLAFGLCFQLPIGVWFGARLGLIDHKDMIVGFRYAIVAMFVLAAIITPPDVFTQLLLGIPMCLLYAMSIGIAWMFTTKVRDPT